MTFSNCFSLKKEQCLCRVYRVSAIYKYIKANVLYFKREYRIIML